MFFDFWWIFFGFFDGFFGFFWIFFGFFLDLIFWIFFGFFDWIFFFDGFFGFFWICRGSTGRIERFEQHGAPPLRGQHREPPSVGATRRPQTPRPTQPARHQHRQLRQQCRQSAHHVHGDDPLHVQALPADRHIGHRRLHHRPNSWLEGAAQSEGPSPSTERILHPVLWRHAVTADVGDVPGVCQVGLGHFTGGCHGGKRLHGSR